jgi:hypothetical protein
MSTTGDRHVIDSVLPSIRNGFVGLLVQLLFIIGIMIYTAPPFAFIQRRGADLRAAPGAAAALEVVFWIAVAITAAAFPLSFVCPPLTTQHWRRGIAARTWPPPSFRPSEPFTAEVLRSDTGKLAFLYTVEYGVGLTIIGLATFFVSFCYFLSSGNPIILGAVGLLLLAYAARFPTRNRIATWIERQQELLDQERGDLHSSLETAQPRERQPRARKRWREKPQEGLAEPAAPDDPRQRPAAKKARPERHDVPGEADNDPNEPDMPF